MLIPRVFISSTYKDLIKYRQEVDDVCRSLKTEAIIMDHFRRTEEPVTVCEQEIDDCPLFVGIYAFRYGYRPTSRSISITEHEFNYALQQGKKILCYLADDSVQQSPDYIDLLETDEEQHLLGRFKARISDQSPRIFKSKEELGKWVAIDLGREYVETLLRGGSAEKLSTLLPLPPPGELGFPDYPFKNLHHFNADDARIFFGRHQVITDIYQHLSAEFPKRVHLVFGQTGVGKSSVFDAGLLKRLEVQGWNVQYVRRPDYGESLENLLDRFPVQDKVKTLIILDQLEELWTQKSLKSRQYELFSEMAMLTAHYPRLFFILGFRKEYLAEIEQLANSLSLPHAKTLVQPLTRKEIVEAVWRIRLDTNFHRYYQLEIDDELPQTLAEDLTRDEESHIAPLLQITLSMMYWEADQERQARNSATTMLSKELYRRVRQRSLEDFVKGQIEQIAKMYPQAVESGLMWDILQFFVTSLSTAGYRNNEEWQERYGSLADIQQLINELENGFLLLAQKDGYRLSHDSLAPIIQQVYRLSTSPGQQAARLLDSKSILKSPEPDGLSLFSETDLKILAAGRAGMRTWTEAEAAAYIHSRQATETLQRTLQERQQLAIRALSNGLAKDSRLALERQQFSQAVRLAEKALEVDGANEQALERLINGHHHLYTQKELQGHTSYIGTAVFSPDSTRILTASGDGTARLWDAQGKHLATLESHTSSIYTAIFSPDGTRILTASGDMTARLWDNQGKHLATLESHTSPVITAVFSPDGTRILTASEDDTARLWDAQGKHLATLEGHISWVHTAIFSPDGTRILTASQDKTARLWDNQGKHLATLEGHTSSVYTAIFSPDGTRILTASYDMTARLWDNQGKHLATLEGHTSPVRTVVFSPDGTRILTASDDMTARLWDAQGKHLATLEGHTNSVRTAVFSPDGTHILTASEDDTARLWDAQGKHLATLKGHTSWINTAIFSPDGTRILTASGDGTARLWDIQGKHLATLEGHTSPVITAVFSPDGTRILTASQDKTARLWDNQGKHLATLEGHTSWVNTAIFSPDGTRILTASGDGTARLWDAQGKHLATLEGHTSSVRTAVFSPDGTRILTASYDMTARLWDLVPEQTITDINIRSICVLTWAELKQYGLDPIEQAAGIDRVSLLLAAEPNEMSLYHYARYYYEIARTQPDVSSDYLAKSLRLYDRLIEHWPLQFYQEKREKALALFKTA